jgi:hypothetical protein
VAEGGSGYRYDIEDFRVSGMNDSDPEASAYDDRISRTFGADVSDTEVCKALPWQIGPRKYAIIGVCGTQPH